MPLETASLFAPLAHLSQEMAALAYFDAERRLVGLRYLPGDTDRLQLPIRLVARDAFAFDARSVVLAHNHPSGDAQPSPADLAFTRRLALCLDALEVRLHDHLIIAPGQITSLCACGIL